MKGGFYCPYCKQCNACDCSTCAPQIKPGEPVVGHTADGNALICPTCDRTYTYNQALDTEWELMKEKPSNPNL
jgi:hypothetical protein